MLNSKNNLIKDIAQSDVVIQTNQKLLIYGESPSMNLNPLFNHNMQTFANLSPNRTPEFVLDLGVLKNCVSKNGKPIIEIITEDNYADQDKAKTLILNLNKAACVDAIVEPDSDLNRLSEMEHPQQIVSPYLHNFQRQLDSMNIDGATTSRTERIGRPLSANQSDRSFTIGQLSKQRSKVNVHEKPAQLLRIIFTFDTYQQMNEFYWELDDIVNSRPKSFASKSRFSENLKMYGYLLANQIDFW